MVSSSRVYVDAVLNPGSSVTLSKPASHHLCTVLRNKMGDSLTVFNGDGSNYLASISSTGKLATLDILEQTPNLSESPLRIHLLQGISRGDRMDTTIQKSVELGVYTITPLLTAKSQIKLTQERLEKKMSHWRAIVTGACEQCQRSVLPILNEPVSLTQFLSGQNSDENSDENSAVGNTKTKTKLVLDPLSTARIGNVDLANQHCDILAGPESGLDESEVRQCLDTGFTSVSLGPRILRTETAGPATIAVMQAMFGDLR